MRARSVAFLLSVAPRPLTGMFLAAALFSVSCTTSGLQPYTGDGQDTAANVDDTGSDDEPADTDTGSGEPTDTQTDTDDGCPTGEVEDCTGACLPEQWLGDGLCQSRFDCAALGYDDGDCIDADTDTDTDTGTSGGGGSGCPSGQVEDCSGVCANRTLMGNGTCDMRFDCALHGYDDGDCLADTGGGGGGGCPVGEIEDCSGGCVPDWWPGDGWCDPELDCAAHSYDNGDCDTGGGGGGTTCPAGQVVGCDGVTCVQEAWLGDMYCDGAFDCAGTNWDEGDCLNCYPDEVIDCAGGCTPASWWDDGICDSGLDCATWSYDGTDCDSGGGGGSACGAGYVEDCDGGCTPESWVGDLYCDASLECGATNWDEGDCLYCWPDEVIDCDGGCTPASWIGDAWCDTELYCATWSYDYGDCD